MSILLRLSRIIDWLNDRLGHLANLLVVLCCGVSAANAMLRYGFALGSNAWLEAQWYMFAAIVMFGAAHTFKRNGHVRIEIFYAMLGERGQVWLDLIGTLVFMIPVCLMLAVLSWPFFAQSFVVDEGSPNPGGLLRWPVKAMLPLGFVLLALQGVSEAIKRVAALRDGSTIDVRYERPHQ